ncbi:MAG: ABC transporter ATP-binding protein/permease [Lachnospiraceae bacterium]|nr:ABC transporter ATP-binding protein/permease [Lachnospiraceae bacterium]
MSAELVTALYEKKTGEELYLLVAITLLGNFVIQVAGAYLRRCSDTAREILENNEAAAFYNKTLSLDYDKIENPKIRFLRRKIRENSYINSYGVVLMRNLIEMLFSSVLDIVFSAVMFAEMISFLAGGTFEWIGILLMLMLVGFVAANLILQGKNMEKTAAAWERVSTKMLEENRMGGGFRMSGADNRIYSQQLLVNQINEKSNLDHLRIFSNVRKKIFTLSLSEMVLFKFSQLCSYLVVCFYCVLGVFPVGSVIKYVGCLGRVTDSVGRFFYCLGALKTNEQFLATYLEYFEIKNDMYQGDLSVEKRSDKKFEIEFRNVSFAYAGTGEEEEKEGTLAKTAKKEDGMPETGGRQEGDKGKETVYALSNINLKLKVGERLAVVGENGSGKTTFIKLLCRLYDPTEGEIFMNDFNIRKYNYRQYLDLFSVVFQDYNLLAVPLGNNVASAAEWDGEKARQLLYEVGFGERYNKMEKGLDTPIYKDFDQEGVNVSGGEAQKIALARALYKDTPFIILDEPTAALDPLAEAEIYAKFDGIVGDKTAIYISHRLSSCRFCDKIAVFDHGKLVQVGTHEELLCETGGKYYELWNAQAQYYA